MLRLRSLYASMALPTTVVLLSLAPKAQAQDVYYTGDNTTYNVNSTIFDSVTAGYADASHSGAATSPTVIVGNNGQVFGDANAYNSSTVQVNNGQIFGNLNAYNSSTVQFSNNGFISGNVNAYNSTKVQVSSDADISGLNTHDNTSVTFRDSHLGGLYAYDNSRANFVDSAASGLEVYNNSRVTFSGGDIYELLTANDNSTINLSGSLYIGTDVYANDNSTINVSGLGHFSTRDGSLYAQGRGHFNFFGANLSATLDTSNTNLNYFEYDLSGTLSNGYNLDGTKLFASSDNFNAYQFYPAAVPELSSVLGLGSFLTLGGLAALRQWRQAHQRS